MSSNTSVRKLYFSASPSTHTSCICVCTISMEKEGFQLSGVTQFLLLGWRLQTIWTLELANTVCLPLQCVCVCEHLCTFVREGDKDSLVFPERSRVPCCPKYSEIPLFFFKVPNASWTGGDRVRLFRVITEVTLGRTLNCVHWLNSSNMCLFAQAWDFHTFTVHDEEWHRSGQPNPILNNETPLHLWNLTVTACCMDRGLRYKVLIVELDKWKNLINTHTPMHFLLHSEPGDTS